MPDLKASTNHLDPLLLPAQLVYYYGYMEGRFGLQVRRKSLTLRRDRVAHRWNRAD